MVNLDPEAGAPQDVPDRVRYATSPPAGAAFAADPRDAFTAEPPRLHISYCSIAIAALMSCWTI